mmetsp:Transcript_31009/g.105184  ORF Transcript_31009/g.105184 Transcript_31009/m.105184 type:complete len:207 (-) Transcript_31009:560-1180(-)
MRSAGFARRRCARSIGTSTKSRLSRRPTRTSSARAARTAAATSSPPPKAAPTGCAASKWRPTNSRVVMARCASGLIAKVSRVSPWMLAMPLKFNVVSGSLPASRSAATARASSRRIATSIGLTMAKRSGSAPKSRSSESDGFSHADTPSSASAMTLTSGVDATTRSAGTPKSSPSATASRLQAHVASRRRFSASGGPAARQPAPFA